MDSLTDEQKGALEYLIMSACLGLLDELDYNPYRNKEAMEVFAAIFGAGSVLGFRKEELQFISDKVCENLRKKGYPAINFQITD